jgi:hypothetical protein
MRTFYHDDLLLITVIPIYKYLKLSDNNFHILQKRSTEKLVINLFIIQEYNSHWFKHPYKNAILIQSSEFFINGMKVGPMSPLFTNNAAIRNVTTVKITHIMISRKPLHDDHKTNVFFNKCGILISWYSSWHVTTGTRSCVVALLHHIMLLSAVWYLFYFSQTSFPFSFFRLWVNDCSSFCWYEFSYKINELTVLYNQFYM